LHRFLAIAPLERLQPAKLTEEQVRKSLGVSDEQVERVNAEGGSVAQAI
jgi:hypothetical protein